MSHDARWHKVARSKRILGVVARFPRVEHENPALLKDSARKGLTIPQATIEFPAEGSSTEPRVGLRRRRTHSGLGRRPGRTSERKPSPMPIETSGASGSVLASLATSETSAAVRASNQAQRVRLRVDANTTILHTLGPPWGIESTVT